MRKETMTLLDTLSTALGNGTKMVRAQQQAGLKRMPMTLITLVEQKRLTAEEAAAIMKEVADCAR